MQSAFLNNLRIEQIGWRNGRAVWLTRAPLRYYSVRLRALIVIDEEFITDLASVPRLPLAYLVAGGRGNRSAVIHDFPYQFGYWWVESEGLRIKREAERSLVDEVFHESLIVDPMSGAGPVIAWQMWGGVRVVGRGVWADRQERAPQLNPQWANEWGMVRPT